MFNGGMSNADQIEYWNRDGGPAWVEQADRFDRMLRLVGARLLEAAAPMLGEKVLDVGCGNGAITLETAQRVSTQGQAVGLDISAPMLELARRRADSAGLADIARFVEADAQTASLDEAPFDVIVSRFGVMFFADPWAAFANLVSMLRPGGRIAFVCWQDMFQNQWIMVPSAAAIPHVGMPAAGTPGAPGPFALADSERIKEVLASAGLSAIEVEAHTDGQWMGRDVDDVVGFLAESDMARRLFEGKEPASVERAMASVREALQPFASAEGVMLNGAYWLVTAEKP